MDRIEEVESVTKELRNTLARAGIVLPSLGPDPVSCANYAMLPLVELGRCTMDVARRLTDALGER
ncbi:MULTISPECIES: hypothetical protein [Streptomyces]|uniref:Uncharacterized protein n=3 Tax=Streptomyces TaxID=1883 RepID=A0A553ZQC7_9ACTN|nr:MULTISPECIES: hypothetical protein [Streptomyces]TSB31792.1 hypothetical protein FNJ62_04635 [Streptomyces benahoarensis]TSB43678.1 hypothetical protein FNZ23_03025 [Streptomyces benahoarensis]